MYISHERGRKGSHHRFITEKRVFENWARTFDIHFFQPDWKPEPLTVTHPRGETAGLRDGRTSSVTVASRSSLWTLWAGTAAWRRRVTGSAAGTCSSSQGVGMEEQHTPRVLSAKLYQPSPSPFGAIWLPVCVCDSWNTTWVSLRDG